MKKFLFTLTALFFTCIALSGWSSEQDKIILDSFASGISEKWQMKEFKGLTHYTVTIKDKQTSIKAESDGTASGLFYDIKYSAKEFPLLSWKWQIENIVAGGDVSSKETDDYAARIYVVFPHLLFWRTKALNYIWANKLPKETFTPNAYTKNCIMIALQSGNELAGRWVNEERNLYQDFITAFGHEPPTVGAIAIMTDTDNTGGTARAWYGPISYSRKL